MVAKIKYVFSISQPMQYVNALEVVHARKLPKEECAVLFFNKPFDLQIDQLKALVNPLEWGEVQYIAYPSYWLAPGKGRTVVGKLKVLWSKLFSARGFDAALREFLNTKCQTPLELVATGNYVSRPHRHLLAIAEKHYAAKELMLIDEGTALPNFIVPIRHNPNGAHTKHFKGRFSRFDLGSYLMRLFGLRFHHPKAVTFFSIYEGIKPPKTDTVEINHFAKINASVKDFKKTDDVWFLGTCFVEHNFTTPEHYLDVLRAAKTQFAGKTVYYFPHRYESDENLKNIAALGFVIKRPNMAIEPWLIANKKLPVAVAAIVTSAIDNISHIFKGALPIHIFKPSEGFYLDASMHKTVNGIIEGHVKNGHKAVTTHYVDFAE